VASFLGTFSKGRPVTSNNTSWRLLSVDIPCALRSKEWQSNNVYESILHWKSGTNHNISGEVGFDNALRDVPSSKCVNWLLTWNSLVHCTHVFVIIRFSATNWQKWCCCECKRLSICAALNYHKESLPIPAYYHDNDRKLPRCRFFTSAVKVIHFTCGNKKDLFPVSNQHRALKNQSQTSKVLMFKEHRLNEQNA